MTFFKSLLAKYMALILTALVLVQVSIYISAMVVFNTDKLHPNSDHFDSTKIEEKWHAEARNLQIISEQAVQPFFERWKQQYPEASMFWVDGKGRLRTQLDVKEELPVQWTALFTARFLKERYGGDPFTVVSLVGREQEQGFIVFELPRELINPPGIIDRYETLFLALSILLILLFIVISFLFFQGIRKRLVHLQEAMEIREVDGLPIPIVSKKEDEIGRLEHAFNQMVQELQESRQREQKEEQLRRELIANLSHDLRTPLTKVQAHMYSLRKEHLSEDGRQSVDVMEKSIKNVDRLMDNLMSYTLLSARKYTFHPEAVDMVRLVRASIASWYPLFEKEKFDVLVELELFEQKEWLVDPLWMNRILDNLFQNVLRHAKSGRYIGVKTESEDQYDVLMISDRGKGMANKSDASGAGIGLSIVDMMITGMKLEWEQVSDNGGTVIKIKRNKHSALEEFR